jgi:hypothetical protein
MYSPALIDDLYYPWQVAQKELFNPEGSLSQGDNKGTVTEEFWKTGVGSDSGMFVALHSNWCKFFYCLDKIFNGI